MSIYKRGKNFYMLAVIDGVYYRESLHTTDVRKAPDLERQRIAELKASAVDPAKRRKTFGNLDIADATAAYIEERQHKVSPRMCQYWHEQAKPVAKFFGNKRLKELAPAHIDDYQSHRLKAGRRPKTINGETATLRQLLRHAKFWHKFAGEYHALRDDRPPVRRALSDTDIALLLEVASSREDWFYAYVATVLGAFAGLRSVEIRHLQWQYIDFIDGTIDIRRSKTAAGRRLLSMNSICRDTLLQLREQATLINATDPEHYLFPAYVKNQADPTKPMKSWRSAWRSIRKSAGVSARFHDLRVSAVTMLAEKGVPLAVIQAQIGHTSPEMVAYYTRIRRQAMDDVAAALEPTFLKPRQAQGTEMVN